MNIAIIGSGISGLACAYYLSRKSHVTIYEANDYIGGHTATVDIVSKNQNYAIDTGFIVYNNRTYPRFINLLNELGVTGHPTQMSFSVRNDVTGLEYNGHTLGTLFAQRRNLLNGRFYAFILEILRFNRLAKRYHRYHVDETSRLTLGSFLERYRFSDFFCQHYILPMGAAIWSSTVADMRAFPLSFFLRFFLNHGLLDIADRPQWYVIQGGSRSYIKPMIQPFHERIHLNTPVIAVKRLSAGVEITTELGKTTYDEVVFACHSDQALQILQDPTQAEQEILSSIGYQTNQVTLHTDTSLLPHASRAWAAWNYRLCGADNELSRPALTYNMNILQNIDAPQTFCVSLNSDALIDPKTVLQRFAYEHPIFNVGAVAAQNRRQEINGHHHTWYCGAYWYNGFHEDGVKSAVDVVIGVEALAERLSQGVA
jgi:predicted NAD/FAD-binding protein